MLAHTANRKTMRHARSSASLRTGFAALTLAAMPCVVGAQDVANRTVGPQPDGSIVASSNQTLTPAGRLIDLGTPVRAKAVALNPKGKSHSASVLLMGSPQPVIVVDTATGQVLQRFLPTTAAGEKPNKAGSFTGIVYSPDGQKLLFSQDDNHLVVATVDPRTGLLTESRSVDLPKPVADGRPYHNPNAINPGGIAVSDDGRYAYVVLNAANTLGVIDLAAAQPALVAQIAVGNAPNSVVLHGRYAYVSNEGGRPATPADFTNTSDGTPIVVDREDSFAITGTVSVVDLAARREVKTIDVGLHPAGMAVDATHLYVANAYGDSLSVVDLRTDKQVRAIDLGAPVAGGTFGAGPNAVALVGDRRALVTLGESNAVAVVNLAAQDAHPVIGYIPTAYFPTSIAYDAAARQLVVADDKGVGARGSKATAYGVTGFNTHRDQGTINLVPLPDAVQLARFTQQVTRNNHWDLSANIQVGPEYIDHNAAPVAIPRHIGEQSLIKHVFLIIKENRGYDQMLGDVAWGNGDPSLAVFAPAVPNQHALIKRFPLLDNVYAPSRQSADGHPWIGMSGSFYSNDILAPDFIRSYPGGDPDDALAYTPKGFLWSELEAKGLTARLYGEWGSAKVVRKPGGGEYGWADFYATALCQEGKAPASSCIVPDNAISVSSPIPSASRILDPRYPPFDLKIPDQYRANYWISAFRQQDAAGTVPNLTIIWLPDDHTAGATKGQPTPAAYQADNDLALGRIVEAISHSKAWATSAIFVEEDDAQNGIDHVDGHRQPVFVISPYAVAPQAAGQGKAIHTTYTAVNINRTIENILGLHPLTQFDLVASPMFDAFQDRPDLTPFDHVPASMPLDEGVQLVASADRSLQEAWFDATAKIMNGKYNKADAVEPNFLNHSIWYAATGWKRPYPGETRVSLPGAFVKVAKGFHDEDDD
jgi:DNA-binding beta-propeller fold protein YncE